MLQQHGLAGPRRSDDQGALPFTERREQIHHAGADRLGTGFEPIPFLRSDRRELIEILDVEIVLGSDAVNVQQFTQARALLFAMVLHHAAQQQAFAQAELLDHRARHKGIGPLTSEIRGRITEKAVAVGVHFEHA